MPEVGWLQVIALNLGLLGVGWFAIYVGRLSIADNNYIAKQWNYDGSYYNRMIVILYSIIVFLCGISVVGFDYFWFIERHYGS